MNDNTPSNTKANNDYPVLLITGGSKRIGAEIIRTLHPSFNIVLHYRHSSTEAQILQQQLNQQRNNSCKIIQANLDHHQEVLKLAEQAKQCWGKINTLINNASQFFPSPIGQVSETDWDALMSSNLKAPFFLSQALAEELKKNQGNIINIADIYAERPLREHTVYAMAKAGLKMMTESLAKELGPQVRVNAIAPGPILWPESKAGPDQEKIIQSTALKRQGSPADVAKTTLFLLQDGGYITGEMIRVDGGRHLTW